MKLLISILILTTSAMAFASTGDCETQAINAAYTLIGDEDQNAFAVYEKQFLGKVELPDLLDGNDSVFFESYYFIMSADIETAGVSITTNSDCTINSEKILGKN